MRILNKTKVYLCGAMEFAPKNMGRTWRDDMTEFLGGIGVTVFDPYKKPFINAFEEDESVHQMLKDKREAGDFDFIHRWMKKVRAQDLSCVDKSDFLIAYIDARVNTVGSIEEISTAVKIKRPIFIVCEGGVKTCPLWLLGMMPPKYFYNDFDELKATLIEINSGRKELDSDRWRLLKEELR